MRKTRGRMLLAIMTACALTLCACASGSGQAGTSGQAQGGASAAQQNASGASGSSGDAARTDDVQTGTENTDASSSDGTQQEPAGITLIPLLIDDETNALTIGSYEWGGRIVTDGGTRYDALEARLRTINEENSAEGVTAVYITRSDETAVSLVIVKQANNGESASCKTYVLNPETGKELRLTDVVQNTDAFEKALDDAEEAQADSGQANAGQIKYGQENWTLDYDGITVYPQDIPDDTTGNIPCVTVYFKEQKEVFQEAFLAHPANYLIQMLPGRTYTQITGADAIRAVRGEVLHTGKAPQYPYTLTLGERTHEIYQVRDYSALYLAYLQGSGFVLEDLPRLENTYLSNTYVMNLYDPADQGEKNETQSTLTGYGLADHGALDPKHLRLFDDTFTGDHALMNRFAIAGYAHYALSSDGRFVRQEDFWYLQGPERETLRQIDTLGYRLYDAETLVSKQITRGMQLAPYRTDGTTFFEVVGNGDVFRFEIEHLEENAKLNGTYTFDMLFGT